MTPDPDHARDIARIDVHVFRVPIAEPVVTAFGAMRSRPAVFLRLEDTDGAFGWGEIFANWPAAGAEHRARLVTEDISDRVLGRTFREPAGMFRTLMGECWLRALQCGEWGPFGHAISGLDAAYHDLLARKAGLPLARYLSPDAALSVPAYASGIHIRAADRIIGECRDAGHSAYKIKVGFDVAPDAADTVRIGAGLGPGERLFTDANQGWNASEAMTYLAEISGAPVGWLEEPIPADADPADWQQVADAARIPIAGGENIAGDDDYDRAIGSGIFGILQPDVAKWGGVSGCFDVARRATGAGMMYCPHFLGGGIGLLASAALLAAEGGAGLLEVDVNPNPLRAAFGLWAPGASHGVFSIPDSPGLGIVDLPAEIAQYRTLTATVSTAGGSMMTPA